MNKIRDRLIRFMYGRYGNDELNTVLLTLALIVILSKNLLDYKYLEVLPLILLIYVNYRTFSKQISKRQAELQRYFKLKEGITKPFISLKRRLFGTKTHAYFRCPNCTKELRIPKGKGKLKITCPHCAHTFVKRT